MPQKKKTYEINWSKYPDWAQWCLTKDRFPSQFKEDSLTENQATSFIVLNDLVEAFNAGLIRVEFDGKSEPQFYPSQKAKRFIK